jgi:hypothetical protein
VPLPCRSRPSLDLLAQTATPCRDEDYSVRNGYGIGSYERHGLWPKTLGADGNYKEGAFLAALEGDGITPHVPLSNGPIRGLESRDPVERVAAEARRRAKRRMKTKGYAISQRVRKRVEELIGWCKMVGGLARAWFIGRWKIRQQSEATAAAYNLLRMARLAPAG